MPLTLEDRMRNWVARGQHAIVESTLHPTVAGFWPMDCVLAQESKADCFCLSFPPPKKDKIPELCSFLKMQLHYHNAQAYVYLSTMTVQVEGKATSALGVFGSNRILKLFWLTPYNRNEKGEVEFSETFAVSPTQVGPFGDLFLGDENLRPGMPELIRDLFTFLQAIQTPPENAVEGFFATKGVDNPFPGMNPAEALSLCSSYLKSRQSDPLTPSGSILSPPGGS